MRLLFTWRVYIALPLMAFLVFFAFVGAFAEHAMDVLYDWQSRGVK